MINYTLFTDGQKYLTQIRDYNILKPLDNTILGIFIGLISGIGMNTFMNQSYVKEHIWFILCCGISIMLLVIAMKINSCHINECKKCALNQYEMKDEKYIRREISKTFFIFFLIFMSLSCITLFLGICKFNPSKSPISTQIICPCQANVVDFNDCQNQLPSQIEENH